MRKYLNFNLLIYIVSFLLISASAAYAFTGPGSQSPGSGSGAISADSNGNISIGGTATSSYSIYVPGNTLYGIRAHGSTMGGRFEDTDSSARGYVGYGDYDFYGNGTGLIQSTGSVRAPIFYDSDNTNYFINPSATGLSASFAGSISVGTTTASNDFYIAGPGSRHFKIESTTGDRTGFNLIGGGVFWEFNGHEDGYFRIREDGVNTGFILNSTDHRVFIGANDSMGLNSTGGHSATLFVRQVDGGGQLKGILIDSGNNYSTLGTSDGDGGRLAVGVNNTGGVYLVSGQTSWSAWSDENLKNNIQPISNSLDKLNKINGYYYNWIDEEFGDIEERKVGLIAQEVEEVLPEVVSTDENGIKSIRYTEVIPLLVNAIKEQNDKTLSLEKKIEDLEKRLSELEK